MVSAAEGEQVQVERTDTHVIVSAGPLTVRFVAAGKRESQIDSIVYRGREYLQEGQTGYIRSFGIPMKDGKPLVDKKQATRLTHSWQCVVRERCEYTEVVFSEEARPEWPVTTEQGFVFRKDEPGFYYYLSYRHPADLPDVLLQQTRMTLRVKEGLFQKARIDRDRTYDVVPLEEWEGHVSVMDASYMLTDGRIITKYTWSTRKENQQFYGFAGEEAGIWHLFPSMEHVNGGANKQSNSIQHSPEGPIVLNVMSSSHYGAEMTCVSGEWSKLYGPFFFMVTDEKGWQGNLAAAEEKQGEMGARWPFAWFEHPLYARERGKLKGQVAMDGHPAEKALILLTTQQADSMSDTLNHGLGYMFWGRTDENGLFAIDKIRPGSYYLHCSVPGAFGDFSAGPYEIEAGVEGEIGLIEFEEEKHGKLLWQIGVADRNSTEFSGAQDKAFRPWGSLFRLVETFGGKDNPVFHIGKSDPARDFYFAHPIFLASTSQYLDLILDRPGADPSAFTNSPVRRIAFQNEKQRNGTCTLTLALASAREAHLQVHLNGELLEDFSVPHSESAGPRSGSYGRPWTYHSSFSAEKLRVGDNLMAFSFKHPLRLRAVPLERQENREVNHGIVYREHPGNNLRRYLESDTEKSGFFSVVLYDAIKLEYREA